MSTARAALVATSTVAAGVAVFILTTNLLTIAAAIVLSAPRSDR